MGVDKEATDIWKFGRARDDLTLDQTLAEPMPNLSVDEQAERQKLIDVRFAEKYPRLREITLEARNKQEPSNAS